MYLGFSSIQKKVHELACKFLKTLYMLKVRLITTMLWNGTTLVKGNKFENEKDLPDLLTTVKIYNSRDVDEILFFDISRNNKIIDRDFILSITDCVCSYNNGGGIENISDE